MPAQGEQSISTRTVTTRDPGLYIPSCPCLDRRMRHMASVKKCARARWTRSFGSRFSPSITSDSAIFSDFGNPRRQTWEIHTEEWEPVSHAIQILIKVTWSDE